MVLRIAAEEYRFLLNRGYPRDASLTLVGNRHALSLERRQLLGRAVVSSQAAASRRSKLRFLNELAGGTLAIDGFNVLITLEEILRGSPLVLADDGVVRDISGLSSAYRPDPEGRTGEAFDLIFSALDEAGPQKVFFGFEKNMSGSGILTAHVRERLNAGAIRGDASTLQSVIKTLPLFGDVIVSGNSALLDRADHVFDLAGFLARRKGVLPQLF